MTTRKPKPSTKKDPTMNPMFCVRSVPYELIDRFKLAALLSKVPMNKLLIEVMERKIDEMERDGLMPKPPISKKPI